MPDENPINKKRNAGGFADIGTEKDGAIIQTFEFDDKIIIVKEKSIYEFFLADVIDPERINPNLPDSIHKKILEQGSESELVSRTLLQGKMLLDNIFFQTSIDTKRALKIVFEILLELSALNDEISDYLEVEAKLTNEYENRTLKNGSYSIPSIIDIKSRCKTIFQKVHHVAQALMEINTLFYPNDKLDRQAHYETFLDLILKKYGTDDEFTKVCRKVVPFMKLMRAIRDCLDHRSNKITIIDFEIQQGGEVFSPSIQLDFRGEKLQRTSLFDLLPIVRRNILDVFEIILGHLCNRNAKKYFQVLQIPDERKRYPHVKYAFWSGWGDGGYYHQ